MTTLAALTLLSAVAGLWAYARWRRRAFPGDDVALQGRDDAIRAARDAVMSLTGLDVVGWRSFATVWSETEILAHLHYLGRLDGLRARLARWGLVASWRVRFVGEQSSLLVRLNPSGEVLELSHDGDVRSDLVALPEVPAPLPSGLGGGRIDGLWAAVRQTGSGSVENREGQREQTAIYQVHDEELSLRLHLRRQGAAVTALTPEPEIVAADRRAAVRAETWESVVGVGAFLAALVASVAGLSVLAFSDGTGDWRLGAALAGLLLLGLLIVERQAFEFAVVGAYDARASWRAFSSLTLLSSLMTSLGMAFVVFLSVSAGGFLADLVGMPVAQDPARQALVGMGLGMLWLGVVCGAYAWARESGRVRVAAELSGREQLLAGHSWRQAFSLAVQSSLGEESVFRLLTVALIWWATGQPWLGVVVSAALWAATHSGGGIIPLWTRLVELLVVGCVFGLVQVRVGFLAVVVAHFVYNFILTLPSSVLLSEKGARLQEQPDALVQPST